MEGSRLPTKLDTTSNGEFAPVPLSSASREANLRASGPKTRREFLALRARGGA